MPRSVDEILADGGDGNVIFVGLLGGDQVEGEPGTDQITWRRVYLSADLSAYVEIDVQDGGDNVQAHPLGGDGSPLVLVALSPNSQVRYVEKAQAQSRFLQGTIVESRERVVTGVLAHQLLVGGGVLSKPILPTLPPMCKDSYFEACPMGSGGPCISDPPCAAPLLMLDRGRA